MRIAALFLAASLSAAPGDDTVALGRKALLHEGVKMAFKLSQQALAAAPESAAAHEFSGEVLFRQGEFAQADREFERALKLDANFALAWWGRGRVARCEAMRKTAREDFERAHQLAPGDRRIFRDWANGLRGAGYVAALEKYASMADPAPDSGEAGVLSEQIRFIQALHGRRIMTLASRYEKTDIPLLRLINESHTFSYGLEVSVNGVPIRLLLDTGASGVMIERRAAQKAGVVKLSDATFRGLGSNARLPTGYRAIAERLQAGAVDFRNVVVSVADQEFAASHDGLIGTNVFSDFLETLDFANGKLRLAPLDGYDPNGEAPQDAVIAPEMRNFTRMFQFGHMLLVPARVNGSREVLFIIDTGAFRSLISYDMAAEVGKLSRDDKMRVKGINGRVADVYQTGNLSLEFAGFRQKTVGMTAFDLWDQSRNIGTEVSGLLGLPLLDLFTLTIDYRDGLVNFDYKEP